MTLETNFSAYNISHLLLLLSGFLNRKSNKGWFREPEILSKDPLITEIFSANGLHNACDTVLLDFQLMKGVDDMVLRR